MPIDK